MDIELDGVVAEIPDGFKPQRSSSWLKRGDVEIRLARVGFGSKKVMLCARILIEEARAFSEDENHYVEHNIDPAMYGSAYTILMYKMQESVNRLAQEKHLEAIELEKLAERII